MRVINPFQMNNWDISYLFIFILIIQTFLWITVFFELNGNHIPIISEILTSISLFYINGVLILRILRIHNLGNIENFLYTVGLSIAVTMFMGMAIDINLSIIWNKNSNLNNSLDHYLHGIYNIFMYIKSFKGQNI